jgi:hypothetical protein
VYFNLHAFKVKKRSRDSVVGIATTSSPGRIKNFLFSRSSRPALRSTQPPIQWEPEALSPGVKRPGREVDHSPPTSAEVKNYDMVCEFFVVRFNGFMSLTS